MAGSAQQGLRLRFQTQGLRRAKGTPGAGQFKTITWLLELGDPSVFLRDNQRMAEGLQEQVVASLKEGIKRPNVSTGRLAQVTGEPGNVFVDRFTWGVGVDSFLDSSIAKYWRTIDEGSAAVWSHPFAGMSYTVVRPRAFGGTVDKTGRIAGAPWSRAGSVYGGKLAPFRAANLAQAQRAAGEEGTDRFGRSFLVGRLFITKEIEPESYYERAFSKQGGIRQALRVYGNRVDQLWRQS